MIIPMQQDYPHNTDGSHLRCRHCGYSLRGLDRAKDCPECGTSVSLSVAGNLLSFSDPEWVGDLARGFRWLSIWLFSAILFIPIAVVARDYTSGTPWAVASNIVAVIGSAGLAFAITLSYWKITKPDPSGDQVRARKLFRGTSLCMLFLLFVTKGAADLNPKVGHVVHECALLTGIVHTAAMCLYMREIALRIPDAGLARHTFVAFWLMMLLEVLLLIPDMFWSPLGAILLAFVGLWLLRLIDRYCSALNTAACVARLTRGEEGK